MCGIFGILSHSLPGNRNIREALHSIRHRGPDDEGYLFIHIPKISLGMPQELILVQNSETNTGTSRMWI